VIEEFGLPRDGFVREENHPVAEAATPLLRKEGSLKNHPVADAATPLLRKEGSFGSPEATRSRKQDPFVPGSPTKLRDAYYRKIFSYVGKRPVAGANFWAFGGSARPITGQTFWKRGDQWMGDPPMEEQGLNSVFDVDRSTWRVIRAAANMRSVK
jgi:hypothetical protein